MARDMPNHLVPPRRFGGRTWNCQGLRKQTMSILTKQHEFLDADRSHTDVVQKTDERRCLTARERLANRDWLPGLSTADQNDPAVTTPGLFTDATGEQRETEQAALQTVAAPLASPGDAERFSAANREWYPGLCMTCEKAAGCKYPKPEGGVFNCDEFE